MMKDCLQFLIEPAKKIKFRLKETRKKVKNEKKGALTESQLFVMELSRELNRICQQESSEKPVRVYSDPHVEKRDWKTHLLSMLEHGGECDMSPYKRSILDWTRVQRNTHPHGVWPGEAVLMILDDLEMQWKRRNLSHLQSAVELLIGVVLGEHLNKELIPRLWLVQKQKSQRIDCTGYVPHSVWNWICDAAVEVSFDPETAHPAMLLSEDGKRLRCTPEQMNVAFSQRRFDAWCCCLGLDSFSSGRHYWELEVGERDWRIGVAAESALCKGYRALNTQSGYYTLRLERGSDLKALTVPNTPLPQRLIPHRVGVYLDYEEGQLSFYDTQKRAHLYTYNERFTEKLYPLFGTVEMMHEMLIRPADLREPCLCKGPCLFG
ncbi:hypothetical protein DNTS_024640 [Danionella cerebrum]|nr:hypothetical protein DNTS_024640 [Danionella translucida]